MIRRFKFEGDIYETLDCVPMSVRRKLDRIGTKISLEQWQALARGERMAICHLPANLEEEREALAAFINEAVTRTSGSSPKGLSEAERAAADPPAEAPEKLIEHAHAAGVELTRETWEKLDGDERYALIKLGGGPKVSKDFAAALKEMVAAKTA